MEVTYKNISKDGYAENADEISIMARMMELQLKLKKKNEDLLRTRLKLAQAKKNVKRLKEIVTYQRKRIVELH